MEDILQSLLVCQLWEVMHTTISVTVHIVVATICTVTRRMGTTMMSKRVILKQVVLVKKEVIALKRVLAAAAVATVDVTAIGAFLMSDKIAIT